MTETDASGGRGRKRDVIRWRRAASFAASVRRRGMAAGCFSFEEVTKLPEQRKFEVRRPRNLSFNSLMHTNSGHLPQPMYCGFPNALVQYRCLFGTFTSLDSVDLYVLKDKASKGEIIKKPVSSNSFITFFTLY